MNDSIREGDPDELRIEPIAHAGVRSALAEGRIGTSYFHGQSCLYLPNELVKDIGLDRIRSMAAETFGNERLKRFGARLGEYRFSASYFFELPSVLNLPEDAAAMEALLVMLETAGGIGRARRWDPWWTEEELAAAEASDRMVGSAS